MKIQNSKICIVLAILVFLISGTAFSKEDILPSTPKDLFGHAELAHNNKDYKTALKLFRKLQKDFPNSENAVRGWEYIAQCENKLGNQFAAFEAYQQIWDNHKDFGRLSIITRNQMQIGNYYLNVKRYKFAIEIYQQILENAPFSESAPAVQFSLAEAYIGQKDYYSAKFELKKVIEDYPSSQLVDDAAYKLGYVNFLESEGLEYDQTATEEAVVYFRRFIHNFPSSPKVGDARDYIRLLRERIAASLFRKGEFYYNIRANKAANIQFKSVINKYPDTKYADLSREFLSGIKAESGERIVKEIPKGKSLARKKEAKKVDVYERPYTNYKKQKQHQQLAKRRESRKNQKIKELLNKVGKEELHEYVKKNYYIPEIKYSRLMAIEWEKQKTLLAEVSIKKSDAESLKPIVEKLELEEFVEVKEKQPEKAELPLDVESSEEVDKKIETEKVASNESVDLEEKTEEAFSFDHIWNDTETEKSTEESGSEDKKQIARNEQNDEFAEQVEELLTESVVSESEIPEIKEEVLLEEKIDIKLKEINIPQPKPEAKKEDTTFDVPELKERKSDSEIEKVSKAEAEPETEQDQPTVADEKESESESESGWKIRKITGAGNVKRAQYDDVYESDEVTTDMLRRDYRIAYNFIQRGDATRQKGLHLKAKVSYEKALEKLVDIQRKSSTWESEIVNYRINYCRDKLRGIE